MFYLRVNILSLAFVKYIKYTGLVYIREWFCCTVLLIRWCLVFFGVYYFFVCGDSAKVRGYIIIYLACLLLDLFTSFNSGVT